MFAPLTTKPRSTPPQAPSLLASSRSLVSSAKKQSSSSNDSQNLIRSATPPSDEREALPGKERTRPHSWCFANVPTFAAGVDHEIHQALLPAWPFYLPIQAKLVVGSVNDPLESEADRIADEILRTPSPDLSIPPAPLQINRRYSRRNVEGSPLQPDSLEQPRMRDGATSMIERALRSPGRPLDPATRAYFEPRFGQEFSNVRVHSDAAAGESARQLNALAYTVGSDVVFGSGGYSPGTEVGRHLLAHELTHVVQQSAATAEVVQRQVPENGPPAEHKRVTRAEDIDLATSYWEEELRKEADSKGKYKAKSLVDQGWELDLTQGEPTYKNDPREEKKKVGAGTYLFSVKIHNPALKKGAWFAFYGDTGLAPEPEEEHPGLLKRGWRLAHRALDWASLACEECLLGSAIMSTIEGDFKGAILRVGLYRIGVGAEEKEAVAATQIDAGALQKFAKRVGLNFESPTTKQLLSHLDITVEAFIGGFRQARIKSVFPAEFLKVTVKDALLTGGSTVRKLLTDGRFIK